MKPSKPSLPFLISLLIACAQPALAADAEHLLKAAKEAYARDRCNEAIPGFEAYLKDARPAAAKRDAILAALAWCEKQEKKRIASSRQMEFVGVGAAPAPAPAPLFVNPQAAPLERPAGEGKPASP